MFEITASESQKMETNDVGKEKKGEKKSQKNEEDAKEKENEEQFLLAEFC